MTIETLWTARQSPWETLMPYYRFEGMQQFTPNPHLSSGTGAVIKGSYLTLRNNTKRAGTGSQLHYHPNELMVFTLEGRLNCIVGKDRRIIGPGTFVHMPPLARHSIMALEDADVSYLYVKDNTWDLTGFAADESLSDRAKTAGNGSIEGAPRIDGLGDCYVQVTDGLDMRSASARRTIRIDGGRVSFTYREAINGETHQHESAPCEGFAYLISGAFDCRIDNDARSLGPGDILHVSKRASFSLTVTGAPARWVTFEPTPALERLVDDQ